MRIFQEELGLSPERLRLVFQHVEPEDGKIGLVHLPEAERKGGGALAIGGGST